MIRESGVWKAAMNLLRPFGPLLPPSVYSHLWFRGSFTAKVSGTKFQMYHDGSFIENEVFWTGSFVRERTAIDEFCRQAKQHDVVIDVGANTGLFALFSAAANPSARVFAFEPSQANLNILKRNVQTNGNRIKVRAEALSDEVGQATFYDFDVATYSASLVADFRPNAIPRKVDVTTLDHFVASNGLKGRILIKIDVEGHEVAVLNGAKDLFRLGPTLMVEVLTEDEWTKVSELMADFRPMFVDEKDGVVEVAGFKPGNYFFYPRA